MSHIYDPLSRIDVPPPRHDVESDSEEDFSEDEDELLASAGESSASASHLSLSPAALSNKAGAEIVTVLVGQAGEGVAKAQGFTEEGRIDWKGRQVGSWAAQEEGTCILLYPGSAATENISELAELVKTLLKKVAAKSLTLVDQYNTTLYIDTDPSAAMTTSSSSSAPVRYLSSSSGPTSTATYLSTATHCFAPPNYLSHPTHTVSSLLVQEAVYAGISTQVILLPSTAQQARPHTRLVSRKRKSKKRRPQGMQGLTLEEEFPSDDDEEEEEVQDEVDPAPLQVDAVGPRTTGTAGPPMAAFVESRRKSAAKGRAVASGMYV